MTNLMPNHPGFYNPPLTRNEVCPVHGNFESRCFLEGDWTSCPVCHAGEIQVREQEEESGRHAADRLARFHRRVAESGIPDRFRDRRLSTYSANLPGQKRVLAFAQGYASEFDEVRKIGRSAIFVGSPGTGKTHLAVGIGLDVIEAGGAVFFTTVMRAMRRVKDTWSKFSAESEGESIASLVAPDLLILDEVGTQFGSDTERLILFDILNERYERRRPTILISNLTLDDIEDGNRVVPGIKSYLGERVFDRLREDGGEFIAFDWTSFRREGCNNER